MFRMPVHILLQSAFVPSLSIKADSSKLLFYSVLLERWGRD
jgi:hypothetical protein